MFYTGEEKQDDKSQKITNSNTKTNHATMYIRHFLNESCDSTPCSGGRAGTENDVKVMNEFT